MLPLSLLLLAAPYASAETVFLLHGLGRSRASMMILAGRLESEGYETVLVPYVPSLVSLAVIADALREDIRRRKPERYHLIGHSLGSVIIRQGFAKGYPPGLGRVVMLAPPNRSPRLAALASRHALFRLAAGDSGAKLADAEFYRRLPAPTVPFAVIAGDRGRPGEPNDGILTVDETKLDGMARFHVVHHTHTFLMNARETFGFCLDFLRESEDSARLGPGQVRTQKGPTAPTAP